MRRPKLKELPEGMRPYVFHGLELSPSGSEYVGECFDCGKENKLYVNPETGQYSCKVCSQSGNVYTFLRWLLDEGGTDLEEIAEERKLNLDTLLLWDVVISPITGEALVPGYTLGGKEGPKLANIYRWATIDGKQRLLSTPCLNAQVFGAKLTTWAPEVYICEGPWDAMAVYEVIKHLGSEEIDADVIGVPGSETFKEDWARAIAASSNSRVRLLYDSDHPRQNPQTGKVIGSPGWLGAEKVVGLLTEAGVRSKAVRVLKWGKEGYDPARKDGYDVRDHLTRRVPRLRGLAGRSKRFEEITKLLGPPPKEWLKKPSRASKSDAEKSKPAEPIPVTNYRDLVKYWRKALRWTRDLDAALSACLSVVVSTERRGDQLWLRLVGAPGSGKTRLCDALSTSSYCHAMSHIKGFFSGYKESPSSDEDYSLIARVIGKTVVVKEGDTLLRSPQRDEVLAQLRDIYDGSASASYKNQKEDRQYHGRVTVIIAGTKALKALNRSSLGDRFVDVVINRSEGDEEDQIVMRAAYAALRSAKVESDGTLESQHDDKMSDAYRATAGYVNHLRRNASAGFDSLEFPESKMIQCSRLGRLVSFLRSNPDKNLEEDEQEVELPTRLTSQFVRFALCLAVVLNREEIDDEVMSRVAKSAKDTSRGISYDIVEALADSPKPSLTARMLSNRLDYADHKVQAIRDRLHFLSQIGVVRPIKRASSGSSHWQLNRQVRGLYETLKSLLPE